MTHQLKLRAALGSALRPATLGILAVSVLALGVAGCGHRYDDVRAASFAEPVQSIEERHPIEVEKARANLVLQVPGNAHGLNTYQQEKLRHFIGLWRNEGAGKLVVSGNNREALAGVRDILIERVVPVGSVQLSDYDANQPGVKISFARYVAEGPDCGKWPKDLSQQSDNEDYVNFGCSAQHNLAAMIANPKDLVSPRDQADWSDANRKDFVFRAYHAGTETSASTTAVERGGNISDVAKK